MTLALTVGVAKLVPESGEVAYDRLTVPQYAPEHFLTVLGRSEVQVLSCCVVQLR